MRKPLPYLADHTHQRRLGTLQLCFLIAMFVVLARLYYWQILQGDRLSAVARSQYATVQHTLGSRGRIFFRDGAPLATNQEIFTLFAEPPKLERSPAEMAKLLTPIIIESLPPEDASDEAQKSQLAKEWEITLLQKLSNKESKWVSLKRKLLPEFKDKIAALEIPGLGFEREEQRYYPEASMAAHIVGFVGQDQQGEEQGYFGIEGAFNRELEGKRGELRLQKDALGLPIAIGSFDSITSQDGRDVVLTIRRDIQFMLEEKLKAGMEKYGSKTAEAIIMEPATGRILAMASFPNYDPANFYRYSPELYKNLLVSDVYEPGSTMKILTVAAGIDSGAIQPDTKCDNCAGPRTISGYTIRTWNGEYTPDTTITEGLVHSDNTAMIFTAEKVGNEKFVEYLKKFGLGQKTNIELQEEALPPFRDKWKDLDIATASFGQGIAVTGMQMARFAQVIANKGMMVKPTLVQEVREGREVIEVEPKELGQVITPESAAKVTAMMEESAKYGDAKWAIPKGYRIAGKTGTAQIAVAGHYDDEKTVASFIGFAPAEDPKFVMLVKLREPTSSQWGSETAAPLWFSIARDLFVRMGIPPEE